MKCIIKTLFYTIFFFSWGLATGLPHFCVIIPTFNNRDYCLENIKTLIAQSYTDWEAHIIIDGTPSEDDGTRQVLSDFLQDNSEYANKIYIHLPNERRLALHNIYNIARAIKDPETVIVLYDGDDIFLTTDALAIIAQAYSDPTTWTTYGQYINIPMNTLGHCKSLPEEVMRLNTFRQHPWVASHVRTYKAWLFKSIKLEDLLHDGIFYPMAWDVALMPALEMASKGHIRFISEPLYGYRHHGRNDYNTNHRLLMKLEQIIRKKHRYRPLRESRAPFFNYLMHEKADLIIYSKDRPLQLYALLESCKEHVTNTGSITVIYHASNDQFETAYKEVQQTFNSVAFKAQSRTNPRDDFKNLTLETLYGSPHNYVIFAVDDIIVKDKVDLNRAIQDLEETKAYAVFLRLGKNTHYCYSCNAEQGIPPLLNLENNLYAWQMHRGAYDWRYPNNVDMTLYRKSSIIETIKKCNFGAPNSFEAAWASHARDVLKKIGLCYGLSKIINIPMNIVQHECSNRHMNAYSVQELLEKFNQGLKIDITSYWQMQNNAAHTEAPITFIAR